MIINSYVSKYILSVEYSKFVVRIFIILYFQIYFVLIYIVLSLIVIDLS
jgi:hypothetical protein